VTSNNNSYFHDNNNRRGNAAKNKQFVKVGKRQHGTGKTIVSQGHYQPMHIFIRLAFDSNDTTIKTSGINNKSTDDTKRGINNDSITHKKGSAIGIGNLNQTALSLSVS